MAYKTIILDIKDSVAKITVDRPDVLNALNSETLAELISAINETNANKDVRAVIITGAGDRAFVAGADIAAMKDMKPNDAHEFVRQGHECMNVIGGCNKPVIAAVNGFALGGGTELALACDIIYAADTAKFGLPEVKLGLYPGFGGTQRMWRAVGAMRAKELMFTGKIISANEAFELGIVNRVVALAELEMATRKLANDIAANAPIAISAIKKLVGDGANLTFGSALEAEQNGFSKLFTTDDCKEGLAAFLEKRKATFKGK